MTKASAFSDCADLILDAIEDAFELKHPQSRECCKRAIINTLVYFCIPRDGEVSVAELEEQLKVRKQCI